MYNRAVTDKDLEVLLSVIHLKLEAVLGKAGAFSGFRLDISDSEAEVAQYRFRRLALELQGIAREYGYSDLFGLLGDVKRREAMRGIRSTFLRAQFGYHYRFVPVWCAPYYGFN